MEELNQEQINQAWNWVLYDNRQMGNDDEIVLDFLGAKIEKDQYNKDTMYGWCVEYVISPEKLRSISDSQASPFVHENIRVININNCRANYSHKHGQYKTWYVYDGNRNVYLGVYQISLITRECVEKLKKMYELPDDFVKLYFGGYSDN